MKKVRCYYNLRKKCISVQEKVNGSWKVVDHVNEVFLTDAKFKVSEAGRLRVNKEHRKNVHAFVEGALVDGFGVYPPIMAILYYNPYKVKHFMNGLTPVKTAREVHISGREVFAAGLNQ